MKVAFLREIERIRNCKKYIVAVVVIPLFTLLFMATIFGSGKIENIPVGVVDKINTSFSREVIREIDASPTIKLSNEHKFSNEAEAVEALKKMNIYGYIIITPDELTLHYHYGVLAVGGEVISDFTKIAGNISAKFVEEAGNSSGVADYKIESVIFPTNAEFAPIYNPTLNYKIFLAYPFFYIFFQIFILVFTVYIIGTDMQMKWLLESKGSILHAVMGKLLPYIAIFTAQTLLANFVFFCIVKIPFSCSFTAINISSLLLVYASVALGVAIISLIPKVSIAISIASMIGALGATASGVTFPLESMEPAFRVICNLFPVRHFVNINHSLLYTNSPFAYSWLNYAALLLVIPLAIATLPLLKRSVLKGKGAPIAVYWGVGLVMLGGIVGYGFLYSLMYRPNIVEEVKIAAVDNSNTFVSREFLRNLDATQGVRISAKCADFAQAEELLKKQQVKGIIFIPMNFNNLIAEGNESYFTPVTTTTSFLYYLTIQKAVVATMQGVNNALRMGVVRHLPLNQQLSLVQASTLKTNTTADYNSNGGYGSYLLPIVAVVIIFQTILMCLGILFGEGSVPRKKFTLPIIVGYTILALFLTGLIPLIFNLPHLGNPLLLYPFVILFILTTTAFGYAVSPLFKGPEDVMLYVPFFSVGLIFLSGVSYPFVQIPHLWQWIHYLFPTSPAIEGYIKIHTMGCTFREVLPQIITLAVQLIFYSSIYLLYKTKIVPLGEKKQDNAEIRINRQPNIPLQKPGTL